MKLIVFAFLVGCQTVQTKQPRLCEPLAAELRHMNERLTLIEGEIALGHATPKDEPICPLEDRD